uniref:RRM domain-containing protein n=1 Tax=Vombatus ursinus TaxID=29139 RepID=A0A4X2JSP9_VOMUR
MNEWMPIAKEYDPLKAGSIDGTDEEPHDRAIWRAMLARYVPNKGVSGDPHLTLFVGRLNLQTTEEKLRDVFSRYGDVRKLRRAGGARCTSPLPPSYKARPSPPWSLPLCNQPKRGLLASDFPGFPPSSLLPLSLSKPCYLSWGTHHSRPSSHPSPNFCPLCITRTLDIAAE